MESQVSVYEVKITLKEYIGKEEFKTLYDFEKDRLFYGIVTPANLDNV